MDSENPNGISSPSTGTLSPTGNRWSNRWAVPALIIAFAASLLWLYQHHSSRTLAETSVVSILRSVAGHAELIPLADTPRMSSQARESSLRLRLQNVKTQQGARAAKVLVTPAYNAQILQADGVHLVTVLPEDMPDYWSPSLPAHDQQMMATRVADDWRAILQSDLDIAASMHSPEYYRFAFLLTACIIVLTALAQNALGYLGMKYLQSPVWFVKALLWLMAGSLLLCVFPDLQWFGGELTQKLVVPMWLAILIVLAGVVLSHLSERILVAYFRAFSQAAGAVGGDRQERRLETAAHAANMVVKLALVFLGVLIYLSLLGVKLAATLTSLGALGVAIGLLAQELVRNAAAGISILLDDRYGMGDWIYVEGINGKVKVEAFTIFSTRIRDDEMASVCSLPNSKMLTARNSSKLWSQVDYRVDVGYSTDLDQALEILKSEGEGICQDTPSATGPVIMKGVEVLGSSGITLRMQVRTLPGTQWDVARELNRRVKLRFDREGIEMPFQQVSLSLQDDALNALKAVGAASGDGGRAG